MPEIIDKKITIDIAVNSDGQQQVNQYKAAFDSLRSSIDALGKPISDFSKNIRAFDNDVSKMLAIAEKSAAKIIALSTQVGNGQAKAYAVSNRALKTTLSDADKMKEQALVKELQSRSEQYGELAAAESKNYAEENERLDNLFKDKTANQELYQEAAAQLLQQHFDKMRKIETDYAATGPDILTSVGSNFNTSTSLSQPAIIARQIPHAETKPTGASKPKNGFFQSLSGFASKIGNSIDTLKKDVDPLINEIKNSGGQATAAKSGKDESNVKTSGGSDQVSGSNKKLFSQEFSDAVANAKKISDTTFSIIKEGIDTATNYKIAALEKEKNNALKTANQTSAQKQATEKIYQDKETAVKTKAFKQEQKMSIAQAIINGAQAITKVTAQSGIFAPLEIGVVIAETAAQVAKIAAQKPPGMAKGGYFKSDGKGAIISGYSRQDDTNAYLRSGEAVVVSEAMRVPWARNLVSAINVGFGGRDFSISNPGRAYAVGGIFTDGGDANRYYNQPVNDQKNLANTIAYQMINNFPPVYVDVKDINNQQNILAQTINRVNL